MKAKQENADKQEESNGRRQVHPFKCRRDCNEQERQSYRTDKISYYFIISYYHIINTSYFYASRIHFLWLFYALFISFLRNKASMENV